MSDELDEIRKRRLKELQEASASSNNEELRRQQEEAMEMQRQAILRTILSENAKQRLANIKLVKPQMAQSIEDQLIYLAQSGRINGRISEEQLLKLLKQLQSQKRDSTIRFKRV